MPSRLDSVSKYSFCGSVKDITRFINFTLCSTVGLLRDNYSITELGQI